jgi:hemoglobin
LEEYVSPEEIIQMMTEADTNKNGTIEIDEFISVLNKHKETNADGWGRLNLFDRVGGTDTINAVVDKAYEKVAGCAALASYFEGKDIRKITEAQHRYQAASVGGPSPWSGRTLAEIHAGLNITAEAYQTHKQLFQDAARELNQEDLVQALEENYQKYSSQIIGK